MQEYLGQLAEFWAKLGINQKVSVILAGLCVLIGVAVVFSWKGSPELKLLYSNLESSDLSEIIEVIDGKNIPYEIGAGGNSILVPQDKVYSLRMELASRGIPSGGGVGFEIFDKSNFGVSDFVQRTNYLRALQGELARTITQLRGVRSARVMITMPENKILAQKAGSRSKASVFVDTGGRELSNEAVNSIRFLVANGIEGLQIADVSVVDNNGNVLSQRLGDGSPMSGGQMRYLKEAEAYYRNKVHALLEPVVGRGNIVAQVSVGINSETLTSFKEEFDPEGQVIRAQTINEDSLSSKERSGNTVVGVDGNTPAQDIGGQPENSSQEVRKNKTINYEINRTTTELVKVPGTIDSITAAVFISNKGGERTPEQLEKIRRIVMSAIGITDESLGAKAITVQEVAFTDSSFDGVGGESSNEGGLWQVPGSVYEWVELGRNFVGAGVAILVFAVFMRLLKKNRPSAIQMELLPQGQQSMAADNAVNANAKPSVELINELIDQRPDNVSVALKNWVSSQAR